MKISHRVMAINPRKEIIENLQPQIFLIRRQSLFLTLLMDDGFLSKEDFSYCYYRLISGEQSRALIICHIIFIAVKAFTFKSDDFFFNPEGSTDDAEAEASRGRWKQEDRDGYWKMMQKYIGSNITSMVTLPMIIFEPMTMLQKMAELMEYSHLLDMADKTEDPYMRMVYASSWAISMYYAYQRTQSSVSHHPPMSAGHAENEHFVYDCTSKLKTKFLGNSIEVYPVGRTRVTLKRDGVVLDLVPPLTKVHNLIFGRTWVDSPGEMVMTNLTTGDKVVFTFNHVAGLGV